MFWIIVYKQQFRHSDWLKACQLIPNQWNFTSATLNHIRFVFFDLLFVLSKITKKNLCQDLLTIENTDSGLKVHTLHYANELLVRVRLSFQKLLQTCSTCRNNTKKCLGKSNDAYSLSMGPQSTTSYISILRFYVFLRQYKLQRSWFIFQSATHWRDIRSFWARACKLSWTLVSPARTQPR